MSRRNAEILHFIVREHIATGQPVASRTVSRSRRGAASLSPATIRNVMADLAEQGYLTQPHTSAGRIPTEKAFRAFVTELMLRGPSQAELERVNSSFTGVETFEDGFARSSRVLTEMTHNVGIAAAIPDAEQTLAHIELAPLPERRVLAVVVTGDRIVRSRVVTLDDDVPAPELESIRNYINQNFSGWTLAEARRELERRLQLQEAYYDALLKRLNALYARGLLDVDFNPDVHMEGASHLIALDLHLTREKMRELLRALEEKNRVLQLLDRFLEQPPGAVQAQVGLGDVHSSMRELSLIGIRLASPAGMEVKLAVLGPMRMRYDKVITAVLGVGRTLQQLAS